MTTAYLGTGVCTPIGRHGGALAAVRPEGMAAIELSGRADQGAQRAVATTCMGVGMGIALLLETV